MSAADFPTAIVLELSYEGGLVNHPKDPGGLTNMGVTLPALSEYLGRPATQDEVRRLSRDEAAQIYHKLYWSAVRGDELPAGVDLALLDEAINAGRGRAVQHLQQALGLTADRDFGPKTLAAALAADPVALIEKIRLERVAFYRGLPTFPTFGVGWLRRVEGVSQTATAWAHRAVRP